VHPIFARASRLALYLGLWVLVSGLLASLIAGRLGLTWLQAVLVSLPVALVYAFVCLSAWYVARNLPIKTTGTWRILLTGLLASTLSSAVWLAAAGFWLSLLVGRGWLPVSARGGGYQSLIFGFGVLLYLLSLTVGYLLVMFEDSRTADRRALQVQVLAREAELRSLRSQLDPHFLFNCLHSISALTTADPPAARRMCLLLGEFLRETLALGSEGRITMARELKLVDRFLAVERIRFGDRLDVDLSADPDAERCLVPPLLLQPLVENAVTHGIAHLLDRGTIRVVASRSPARLSIVVENPCDPDRPRGTGAGVGLANVRARLGALYGAEAIVNSSEHGGVWRMELSFPATTGPA
jgi:two-component system, LytTR family, sensor histidine kinase AlgZ